MKIYSTLFLALTLFVPASDLSAQDPDSLDVMLRGTLWDADEAPRNTLEDVKVIILRDGDPYEELRTDSAGRYATYLPLDYLWTITWRKRNLYSKTVEIDTRNIPEDDKVGGFDMEIDIVLTEATSKSNQKILEEYPIGKAKFDLVMDAITFDYDWTEKVLAMLE